MNTRNILSIALVASCLILAASAPAPAMGREACVAKGPFLILENQRYALCATASCFTYNQVLYCDCDVMRGDSISTPLSYDSKNICNVNEQGRTNGFMVSTFSLPADTIYPRGREALYTCPGEANKGSGGFAAKGSYGQCDGGICFTSTTNRTFPGFWNWLVNDIICACPFSTICDPSSGTPSGYQISGSYAHGCDPRDCGKCGAGSLDRNKGQCTGNPLANIPEGTIIPVGAPFGTAIDLSCALLNGNVPKLNSCLCQCLEKDQDGNCVWSVIYQSPLIPDCKG